MTSRPDPFDVLERMFERMSQPSRGTARPLESDDTLGFEPLREDSMSTDVADTPDAFVVTMDVPGYSREELDVRVTDDVLYVEAERTESESDIDDDRYIRRERTHRQQNRSIMLPDPVEPEAVTARMNNGVLTVTIPKAEPLDGGQSIEIGDE